MEVVRQDIPNLHVGVYPPNGRVRVATPLRLGDETVQVAVIARPGWIRRQQGEFQQQARQSQREFVSGECHGFKGWPLVRLKDNTTMTLRVRPGTDRDAREAILQQWYRDQLRTRLPAPIAKWAPMLGGCVDEVGIRKIKTCWGSCNQAARRIWLNLELAKKPPACREYVIVHKMVHLIERSHNDRFWELMDRHMPQWRLYSDELNPCAAGS